MRLSLLLKYVTRPVMNSIFHLKVRHCAETNVQSEHDVHTLTELAALSDEARPAGALSADVVAVRSVLTATHFGALGAVETRGTACGGNTARPYEAAFSVSCSARQTPEMIHEAGGVFGSSFSGIG